MTLPADVLERLRGVLEADGVKLAQAAREQYSADGLPTHRALPGAVVIPRNADELAAVVRELAAAGVPFVARGAGTGLSGGALANSDAVLIVLTRLDRILEMDPADRIAVVEPGVVNQRLTAAAAPHGLHYAPDPASQTVCTIGGNLAENAGGPHCLKYGVTTNHVHALDVLLPDGSTAVLGSAGGEPWGPDLVGLFVGSEGLFGIATRATVRLTPAPRFVRTFLADYESLRAAGSAVSTIIEAGIVPAALEMMDRNAVGVVEASIYRAGYPTDAAAVLLVELDGFSEAALREEGDEVAGILSRSGARSVRQATAEADRIKLWQGRKKTFGALGRLSPDFVVQDTVVPRTALPDVLEQVAAIAARHGLTVANVFHAGDGNLHPNIAYDGRDPAVVARVERASGEIMRACIAAGGTITGEHGVGLDKTRFMPLVFDADTLDAMHAVRRVFDPAERANPGKVLPRADGRMGGWTDRRMEAPQGTQRSRRQFGSTIRPSDHPPIRQAPDLPTALRSLLGPDAVQVSGDIPRVTPRTEAALALVLREASERGWRVRIEGAGSWMPADAPADLAVSTEELDAVPLLDPADLVATAQAGVSWSAFAERLGEAGAWVALDPPGDRRTVGSVVSTATAGPLRAGFGPVRDHLLGLTFVTGDGRILRVGGRVMKNVAGFDLTRLACGSFGAFGVITSATFRLRARPRSNLVLLGTGKRDALLHAARSILAAGLSPAELELRSPDGPGAAWTLAVRFVGSKAETEAAVAALAPRTSNLEPQADGRMGGWADGSVVFRLGALPSQIEQALDLIRRQLGEEGPVSVTVSTGAIRWSGEASTGALGDLRTTAAALGMPLTLERAPWPVRSAVGHFGAYRKGVAPLVRGLRAVFDPAGTLVTGVEQAL